MDRQKVTSSNIAAIGYDPETKTLEVEFKRGQVYSYKNVPEAAYVAFGEASSKGLYFEQNIKTRYPFKRV